MHGDGVDLLGIGDASMVNQAPDNWAQLSLFWIFQSVQGPIVWCCESSDFGLMLGVWWAMWESRRAGGGWEPGAADG